MEIFTVRSIAYIFSLLIVLWTRLKAIFLRMSDKLKLLLAAIVKCHTQSNPIQSDPNMYMRIERFRSVFTMCCMIRWVLAAEWECLMWENVIAVRLAHCYTAHSIYRNVFEQEKTKREREERRRRQEKNECYKYTERFITGNSLEIENLFVGEAFLCLTLFAFRFNLVFFLFK